MGALLDRLERDAMARRVAFALVMITYTMVVVIAQQPRLVGDEWRYLWYAENLLEGHYSPPEFVFLWNGPLYPLFLAPMVFLGLPLFVMKLANVVLLGVAIVFFYRFVRSFSGTRVAVLAATGLFLYLPVVGFAPFVYTEVAAFTLVVLFVHALWAYTTGAGAARAWPAGICLGCLCLTKIVFGPLMLLGFVVSVIWFVAKRRTLHGQLARVFGIAFLVSLPYLAYSYRITGHAPYWGSGGGSTIYWMSNPHPGQLGDWFSHEEVRNDAKLSRDHWRFIEQIGKLAGRSLPDDQDKDAVARYLADLSSVDADYAYRRRAYDNIRRHPEAYLKNWLCNVSRLILDFPYTVRPYTVVNVVVGFSNLSSLILAVAALRSLIRERSKNLGFALFIAASLFVYLGMLSLVSASGRFFVPVAPLCLALGALAFAPALARRGRKGAEK